MVNNIAGNIYGENALCITGPKVLGNHVKDNMHFENNVRDKEWKNSYLTYNKKIIVKNSYFGYYEENDYENKLHYNVLWKEKKAFVTS